MCVCLYYIFAERKLQLLHLLVDRCFFEARHLHSTLIKLLLVSIVTVFSPLSFSIFLSLPPLSLSPSFYTHTFKTHTRCYFVFALLTLFPSWVIFSHSFFSLCSLEKQTSLHSFTVSLFFSLQPSLSLFLSNP